MKAGPRKVQKPEENEYIVSLNTCLYLECLYKYFSLTSTNVIAAGESK